MVKFLIGLLAVVTVFTGALLIIDYKRAKQGKEAIFWERKEK